jgi:FMN phosphatase YigB (HAD superfamily)
MIIIDFDGTLVDVWNRYYQVFLCVTQLSEKDIPLSYFKQLKQKYLQDAIISNKYGVLYTQEMRNTKRVLLEEREFLSLDTPLINESNLEWVMARNDTLLLTIRRNPENLEKQMESLGWGKLLPKVHVLPAGDVDIKYKYAKTLVTDGSTIHCIGDSESDFAIGKLDHAKVYTVSTGLRRIGRNNSGNFIIVKNVNVALDNIRKKSNGIS